jgi:hypothetical protein
MDHACFAPHIVQGFCNFLSLRLLGSVLSCSRKDLRVNRIGALADALSSGRNVQFDALQEREENVQASSSIVAISKNSLHLVGGKRLKSAAHHCLKYIVEECPGIICAPIHKENVN